MKLVDSKKQQLNIQEIVAHATHHEKANGQDTALAISIIIEEINQPNTQVKIIGNTLFIVHTNNEQTQMFLRPINVDTHENYVKNIADFMLYAQRIGTETLVVVSKKEINHYILKELDNLHICAYQTAKSKKTNMHVTVVAFIGTPSYERMINPPKNKEE